jgi:hypothetical protein
MRRVIRRRIRHTEDGLDVAVDFNADVAINVGGREEEPPPEDDPAPDQASDEEGKQP